MSTAAACSPRRGRMAMRPSSGSTCRRASTRAGGRSARCRWKRGGACRRTTTACSRSRASTTGRRTSRRPRVRRRRSLRCRRCARRGGSPSSARRTPSTRTRGRARGMRSREISADDAPAALRELDALVVCNPNNPTAAQLARATLAAWHARLAASGGWLIIDEAFADADAGAEPRARLRSAGSRRAAFAGEVLRAGRDAARVRARLARPHRRAHRAPRPLGGQRSGPLGRTPCACRSHLAARRTGASRRGVGAPRRPARGTRAGCRGSNGAVRVGAHAARRRAQGLPGHARDPRARLCAAGGCPVGTAGRPGGMGTARALRSTLGGARMRSVVALLGGVLVACAARGEVAVTDDLGERVALAAPARRIVSLAPHVTELLFAAGAGAQVVGTVDYSDYPPEARAIRRVGGYSSARLRSDPRAEARPPRRVGERQRPGHPAAAQTARGSGLRLPAGRAAGARRHDREARRARRHAGGGSTGRRPSSARGSRRFERATPGGTRSACSTRSGIVRRSP